MYEKIKNDCRDRYVSKYTVPKTKFTDPNERLLELIVTLYCAVKLKFRPLWSSNSNGMNRWISRFLQKLKVYGHFSGSQLTFRVLPFRSRMRVDRLESQKTIYIIKKFICKQFIWRSCRSNAWTAWSEIDWATL